MASLPVDSVELQGKAPRQDSEAPVQRTLFDRLFPERAAQREEDAHLSRDLITGWHQTTQGNCATVATIKASLHKWGDEVFAKHTRDREGNHHVTLRDGHQVLVTAKELETATRMSHFVGDKKRALKKANLCYAVMAKRALEEKHEGANTFVKACKSLNNGEKVTQPAHYLGVADSLKKIGTWRLCRQQEYIAWTAHHGIYGSRTNTDAWGQVVPPEHWDLVGAYVLR